MYYKCVEVHTAVNLKKTGINKKAKILCALKDATEKMEKTIMTQSSERQIERRAPVRQALWEAHMKSQQPHWKKP